MLVNGVAPVIAPALELNFKFCCLANGFVILTLFGVLMVLGSLF